LRFHPTCGHVRYIRIVLKLGTKIGRYAARNRLFGNTRFHGMNSVLFPEIPTRAIPRLASVILTVRNDAEGCSVTLQSLLAQTRPPYEIVVVDGGTDEDTRSLIREFAASDSRIRHVPAPGCNIARGRNLATALALGEIVVSTDAGCKLEPNWLEKLLRPFDVDPSLEFVGGGYRIAPRSLLEQVAGLSTMRGQLDAIDPQSFNASGRSMAYTKEMWKRIGGWPEWIFFSEDTLFGHKLRASSIKRTIVPEAVAHWRPRKSLRLIARQFFWYGTGRGHTQIGAKDFAYNLRNIAIVILLAALSAVHGVALPALCLAVAYFYGWTFHGRAIRISRHAKRRAAYPLCFVVMWTVLASNTAGYLVGSWQRFRDRERFDRRLAEYLGRRVPIG